MNPSHVVGPGCRNVLALMVPPAVEKVRLCSQGLNVDGGWGIPRLRCDACGKQSAAGPCLSSPRRRSQMIWLPKEANTTLFTMRNTSHWHAVAIKRSILYQFFVSKRYIRDRLLNDHNIFSCHQAILSSSCTQHSCLQFYYLCLFIPSVLIVIFHNFPSVKHLEK